MEEKQPVVIQGRLIERERPMERTYYSYPSRYSFPGSAEVSSESGQNQGYKNFQCSQEAEMKALDALDTSDTYNLKTLRENRGSIVNHRFRTNSGRKSPLPGRVNIGGQLSNCYPIERSSAGRTMAAGPRPRQRGVGIENDVPQRSSLMIKIGVSVVIGLIVFLINSIPLPFTQRVADHVRTALTWNFDIDETLGKLKLVGNALPDQIKSVFKQDGQDSQQGKQDKSVLADFASPVKGEVIRSFGEQLILPDTGKAYANQGIDIKTAENAVIYASADGYVAAIEDHDFYGTSIWLDHGNKVFTFYGRVSQINVKIGQQVDKGQQLGSLGAVKSPSQEEPTLHFQIWIDDKPVNPLERITRASQAMEGQGV